MSTTHKLTPYVDSLLERSAAHITASEWPEAWSALELAHILSQPSAPLHVRVHVAMLSLALRLGDMREVLGQLLRLPLAGIGSAVGRFPAGNSGRARVSPFEPMEIPEEARRIFSALSVRVEGTTIGARSTREKPPSLVG